jgi:hypothetical protein
MMKWPTTLFIGCLAAICVVMGSNAKLAAKGRPGDAGLRVAARGDGR